MKRQDELWQAAREERTRTGEAPLSFAQERLWFISKLEKDSQIYNISRTIRLTGRLNRTALQEALDRIVTRHECLRSTFRMNDDAVVQAAAPPGLGFKLQYHEPGGLDKNVEFDAALPLLAQWERELFDLENGPPIRGHLIQMSDDLHVLQINVHHAVMDEWSLSLFYRELSTLYEAIDASAADPLPSLRNQYGDYALWQRLWLTGERLQTQMEYWGKTLQDAPTLVELPGDRRRPDVQNHSGDSLQIAFDLNQSRALKEWSQRHRCSLFTTMLTSVAILVNRLTGQEDFVLATPAANRSSTEVEKLIGLFVNTLALRMDLKSSPTVSELLERVKNRMRHAQVHQDMPFEKLVELRNPVRSMAHHPIAQLMVSWNDRPAEKLELHGLDTDFVPVQSTVLNFDVEWYLSETADGITGNWWYSTALFDKETIARYAGMWKCILDGMLANDGQHVDEIPILNKNELQNVLVDWNRTDIGYPKDRCIHCLLEEQTAASPTSVAIAHGETTLSYVELNERANRLAHYLRERGVRPDTRVAICVERDLHMVIGILGVLKAGGAYVPLDPSNPAQRLAYFLSDSDPVLLLVDGMARKACAHLRPSVPVIDMDRDASQWEGYPTKNPSRAAIGLQSTHLAYVIYTSGSTGEPKGVMVEHSQVVNLLTSMQREPGISPQDCLLAVTTLSFDIAGLELFLPLISGAKLLLESGNLLTDLPRLIETLDKGGVTMLQATPTSWRSLLNYGWCGNPELKALCGGEALDGDLAGELAGKVKSLWNMYGPTEATIWSCVRRVDASAADRGRIESIGRPIANTRVYILNGKGVPSPIGVSGEIYLAGAGVARGYINRPELTSERFVSDHFAEAPGARMYRTGDLGRWRKDGTIEFLGRNDFQVKIRGFRVELGEVECRLLEYPKIAAAAVAAVEQGVGDWRLIAYYTSSGENIKTADLREHLQQSLPQYMVPAEFVHLDTMPVTPNGKLDRNALPSPERDTFSCREYESPIGEVENALAVIWQGLLHVRRVGRRDNFFELGGHSLLAMKLIARLQQKNWHLDVRALFDTQTLRELATQVVQNAEAAEIPENRIPSDCSYITPSMLSLIQLDQKQIDGLVERVPEGARNIQDIYPLTPLQEGILFHHVMAERGDVYLMPSLLAFDTRQRLDQFLMLWQRMIDRHDVLRTAVMWEGVPLPVQVVVRQALLRIEEVALPYGNTAGQLLDRFDPLHFRIDLTIAPLQRAIVAFDEEQCRWLLLQLTHHIVQDGASALALVEEIQTHMQGTSVTRDAPVPFRNYVVHTRHNANITDHEGFFSKMLGDIHEPTAPYNAVDVRNNSGGYRKAQMRIDTVMVEGIRAMAREVGVSTASIWHLAWGLVLARLVGKEDVVFGTVLSGRMQSGVDAGRGIGLFINTLPIRLSIGAESVRQAIRTTHQSIGELLRHEHASLARAQRCSAVPADKPLFTTLLNCHYREGGVNSVPGTQNAGIEQISARGYTNYPLTLSVVEFDDSVELTAEAHPPIDPDRICMMVQTALSGLIEALERNPTAPIRIIDVLGAAERDQILVQWNCTDAMYPTDRCVHELFEDQVKIGPGAKAVICKNEWLSYAQLNEQANRLAHYLRDLGVGPDTRVGICMERGIPTIVGLLAILKAGGAYVPLDPSQPPQRLSYLITDSQPILLLTDTSTWDALAEQLPSLPRIDLKRDRQKWEQCPAGNLKTGAIGLRSSHLAYIIYTSGSTGAPKGVMIEHRNTVNMLWWAHKAFDPATLREVLFATSLSFDLSVYECFAPLTTGGCTRITKTKLELFNAPEGVTLINTVPSAIRVMLEEGALPQSARSINCAGEVLVKELAEQLFEVRQVQSICNLYGPSETTTYSTWIEMKRDRGFLASIGRPIANTRIYILDSQLRPVPIGVAGELFIGGAGVARGYLNRPELTAERFVVDPFSGVSGARMYRTGDLGCWRDDGNIEFLGRNDFQVKIRGYRIELGEIEARLAQHSKVQQAVVLAREGGGGNQRLVAYYTGGVVESAELRAYMSESLPEYMLPVAFVHLETLPLSPHGKLDRKALPAPEEEAYALQTYEPPQGEVEQDLAVIWMQLLRVERVGRNDNFFELGGHSLLAIALIECLRQRNWLADVRALFSARTLRELASHIVPDSARILVPENLITPDCDQITPLMLPLIQLDQSQIDRIVANVPGGLRNVQDIYPLAPLQEGILFHHLMGRQGDVYLLQSLFAFDTRDRLNQFLGALQAMVQRHDILRTAVVWEGLPEPVQVVCRRAELLIEEVIVEEGDAARQLLDRYDPRHYRIDVKRAPLCRVFTAFDKKQNRWFLLQLTHHLIEDATSISVMFSEMQVCLLGEIDKLETPVPYRNFIARTRIGVSSAEQMAFFSQMLGDIQETTAPFGVLDVQGNGSGVNNARMKVDESLSRRMRACARAAGVSPASISHLAWGQVLSRLTGRDDVVFGTVLSGRMQAGEAAVRTVGLLINTLPIRLSIGASGTQQALRTTHERLGQLLRYEHTSLAQAQRCSAVPVQEPLFTTLLNCRYRRADSASIQNQDSQTGIEYLAIKEHTNYPLTIAVDDLESGFVLSVEAIDPIDAQRICAMMQNTLSELVTALEQAPTTNIQAVEVLPAREIQLVLVDWNRTEAPFPSDRCVQELFETRVICNPDATAVTCGNESLSYGQLNEQVNRLAHYLIMRGVKPDGRVGLCVERGMPMIVGLLAILKAGGCFVPLDPGYPSERLAYILQDSAPTLVLTHSAAQKALWKALALLSQTVPVLDLQQDASHWEEASTTNVDLSSIDLTPTHLAYIIYTSGSTGEPKGVMVEHSQVVNLLTSMQREPGISPQDCLLAVTTLSFDIAGLELFLPLISGAKLLLESGNLLTDLPRLIETLDKGGVTMLQATPTSWRSLLNYGWCGNPELKALCGGEALDGDLAGELAGKVKSLWNMYGPTEATIWSCVRRVDASAADRGRIESIGRPIANTRVYILNGKGVPSPIGVSGEIYLAGAGVARGYINRPELTSERFVSDHFAEAPGARMYRTGDLGRWRKDGTIEFLGRNDFQVKIRGFRVELGEIETRLASHPQVRDAVVVAREDVVGDKRLVGYYTTMANSKEVGPEQLRGHLSSVLPDYMVPAAYVRLEALPLTLNGKLDRRALPAPGESSYGRVKHEEPVGAVETLIASIWKELLRIERIGRNDNFFELGGNSLHLMSVSVQIKSQLDAEVPLSTMFTCQTVESLAREIVMPEMTSNGVLIQKEDGFIEDII